MRTEQEVRERLQEHREEYEQKTEQLDGLPIEEPTDSRYPLKKRIEELEWVLGEDEEVSISDTDDFEVRRRMETPGMVQQPIMLHNHRNPCDRAKSLEEYRVLKLGKEVPPRPELKEFCPDCEYPFSNQELIDAMLRPVEQFRGDWEP